MMNNNKFKNITNTFIKVKGVLKLKRNVKQLMKASNLTIQSIFMNYKIAKLN